MTEEEVEKWKERPPETGPPGRRQKRDDGEEDGKDYGKGGRR
jgi:hypothetical protein